MQINSYINLNLNEEARLEVLLGKESSFYSSNAILKKIHKSNPAILPSNFTEACS